MNNPFLRPPTNAAGLPAFEGALPPPNTDAWAIKPSAATPKPALDAPVVHHDTFVVFRRWESCKQCKDAVYGEIIEDDDEDGGEPEGGNYQRKRTRRGPPTLVLPPNGYYNCPHVNKTDYEQLVRRLASEDNKPLDYEKTVLKDGSVQIDVMWAEQPVKKEPQRRRF